MRPAKQKSETVAATWRRRGCRDRLFAVYLTPGGWKVVAEGVRKVSGGVRVVAGSQQVLPLDTEQWPAGRIDGGCEHGAASASLAEIAAGCLEFRAARRRVEREIV